MSSLDLIRSSLSKTKVVLGQKKNTKKQRWKNKQTLCGRARSQPGSSLELGNALTAVLPRPRMLTWDLESYTGVGLG